MENINSDPQKTPLIGKTLRELEVVVSELGMPSYTAKQLCGWIYKERVLSIEEMTNISSRNRALLQTKYTIGRTAPIKNIKAIDGTKKYLFATNQGYYFEAVSIPEKNRLTLCISSQVGCKMGCVFCMTGKQGFTAQLSVADIINQILSIPEAKAREIMAKKVPNTEVVWDGLS